MELASLSSLCQYKAGAYCDLNHIRQVETMLPGIIVECYGGEMGMFVWLWGGFVLKWAAELSWLPADGGLVGVCWQWDCSVLRGLYTCAYLMIRPVSLNGQGMHLNAPHLADHLASRPASAHTIPEWLVQCYVSSGQEPNGTYSLLSPFMPHGVKAVDVYTWSLEETQPRTGLVYVRSMWKVQRRNRLGSGPRSFACSDVRPWNRGTLCRTVRHPSAVVCTTTIHPRQWQTCGQFLY